MLNIKKIIKSVFHHLGYDLNKLENKNDGLTRRKKLISFYDINLVLDIGANTGGYAGQMRQDIGYVGKIISFEPLSSAYKILQEKARHDPLWTTYNWAIGDAVGTTEINIASNSYSSSILEMLPSHLSSAPDSLYSSKEKIQIKTLDSLIDELDLENKNVYLKIDTQGYEEKVLKGATKILEKIDTIQLEMSLIPLYQGELLFYDMHNFLRGLGYELVSIESGFYDKKTGQLLQIDGIYHRL